MDRIKLKMKSYLIPILKSEESTKFNTRNSHRDTLFKIIKKTTRKAHN